MRVRDWLPFEDPSRGRRLLKVLAWIAGTALVVTFLGLLGVNVTGWLDRLWDTLTGIGLGYLVAGWSLQTLQTSLTALGWYFILRAGYPELPHDHPVAMAAAAIGVVLLIVVLLRIFRRKLPGLIERAKQGGAILARPRQYLVRVFLPSFGAWLAKLGVIAVFLAGYGISVTFHSVMSVMGGNSIANTVRHAGRRRRQSGRQRGGTRQGDRRGHGHRLLARPAARRDGMEHRVRDRAGDLGVRLGGRPGARRDLLR